MKHLFCVMAVILLQSMAFGEVDVVEIKDLEACVLGSPHRTKSTGETVIRMCIDGKRHMIENISTKYGYEELVVKRVYIDDPYGNCICPSKYKKTRSKPLVAKRIRPMKQPKVPNKEIWYSNARGDKLVINTK